VSAAAMMETLHHHLESTREIYERVIHAQQPIYYSPRPDNPIETGPESQAGRPDFLEPAVSSLVRMMDQRAPELALQLSRSRLQRGAKAFEQFLEQAAKNPEWLMWLDSDTTLAGWVIDLFEECSHFGDLLVRKPELIEELQRLRNAPGESTDYALAAQTLTGIHELRRFYTREMLRIQCESICLSAPIFETLQRMSQLADTAIRVSYRMAIEQSLASSPPEDPHYEPRDQMLVVALGRLGMMEFDIASDADLIFILPDRDAREIAFWTNVAERLSRQIMTYTGEGVIFTVDNRLRPNGREGMLVQTEQSYRKYFAAKAEVWEGIAYMKARTVAGNIRSGTKFLEELQVIDWRRYGQTARSKKMLYDMRMRLEKEQGPENPLKAGRGGYYDIDFCLMYLRLKAAGMFFDVLNTPQRIEVIEKMGHLERSDAAFLCDAATFYRAVDHALRVFSGSSGGRLPRTKYKLDAVHHLVSRWTPDHLHDQPLDDELAQIQTRTREFFERLFEGQSTG
jgi:glutamate-ammonia-ligase adenylyltransferase